MAKVKRTPEEEAARLLRRREMCRERARRRRANPEARAREAEAKRQRRRVDAEARAREAEAKRRRRAQDPEFRAREIAARLRYNEAHREENRLAEQQRRNADPGLRVFENFRRRQRAVATGADERLRREFLNVQFGRILRQTTALWKVRAPSANRDRAHYVIVTLLVSRPRELDRWLHLYGTRCT